MWFDRTRANKPCGVFPQGLFALILGYMKEEKIKQLSEVGVLGEFHQWVYFHVDQVLYVYPE